MMKVNCNDTRVLVAFILHHSAFIHA